MGENGWHLVSTPAGRYAAARSLEQFPFLAQGVTLRGEPADAYNLSFSVEARREVVRRNRQAACALFDFPVESLVVPAQVHGAEVAVVGEEHQGAGALSPETAIPSCDALVTATPGLLLGITIADCLPICFFDPLHRAIGLAHSGWRGTAGRIALRTLEAMARAFGTRAQACLAAIGPGIGPDGYEVDERVHAAFDPHDAAAPGVFTPTRPGHWTLDLTAAVCHQLRLAGVPEPNIARSPWRTHRDTDLFFSHRLVPGCPRMGAFLGLRQLT
ncbi:MAG TPA: polyphenol oxidase family protein [Chthonomonadaceae bacterium]|nr:polyphenol oxidase family protein [Chthonomonadaceae bacterium]